MLDRGDLGRVVGEGLLKRGKEMFRRDLGERRCLQRRLPRLEKRICLRLRRDARLLNIRHTNSNCRPCLSRCYSTRCGFFGPFTLDSAGLFIEIAAHNRTRLMSSQPSPTSPRQIVWPTIITVITASILIGPQEFSAPFAAGCALAIPFSL